jgi:hypothetical protein
MMFVRIMTLSTKPSSHIALWHLHRMAGNISMRSVTFILVGAFCILMWCYQPDILEPDWQQAYWGSHYPRLLAIKKKIDPKDLLIVRKGVNSEGWDDEIICKKT